MVIARGTYFLQPNGFIQLTGKSIDTKTASFHFQDGVPLTGDVKLVLTKDNKSQIFNGKIRFVTRDNVMTGFIFPNEIAVILPDFDLDTIVGSIDLKIILFAGVVKKAISEGLDKIDPHDIHWNPATKLVVANQIALAGAGLTVGIENLAGAIGDALRPLLKRQTH
uniref:Uncharacterized protein n=1 Tax=viral metagenome TaxID=1070528 RepID=A0A6C0KRY0_9ZZZZ